MIKPNGNRAILQLTKRYLMDKGKPAVDAEGNQQFTTDQGAKVLSSNIQGIKKGMTVYPIIRGGVPLYHLETKKVQVIVVDNEDIYAVDGN